MANALSDRVNEKLGRAMEARGLSYGDPFKSQEERDKFAQGLEEGYVNTVMELPMAAMEYIAPEAGYTPGELRSSPQDKIRAERFAWEEYMRGQAEQPGYAQGEELGTVAGYAADPFFDIPAVLAPGVAAGRIGRGLGDVGQFAAEAMARRTAQPQRGVMASGQSLEEMNRLQRAKDMGFETEAFTGSTHDITAFRGDLANPEGDWGRGTYASTSIEDVNKNYAGEGSDLTSRIEREAEQVANALEDYPEDLLGEHGITMDEYLADESSVAHKIARKSLVGEAEGGIVYPLKIKTKNYAVVGGDKPTMLTEDVEGFEALARSEVDRVDYDDVDDFEDAITERIWELKADDPDSIGLKVSDALHESDIYQDTNVIQEIMGELDEEIMDGALRIDSIDDAVRKHVVDAYDDNGEMISAGEISSQVIKSLGFDGVVDKNVYRKFGAARQYGKGMEGINPDTAHIITFPGKESTLRSRFAQFDPSKKTSHDILAGGVPLIVGDEYRRNALSDNNRSK